MDIKAVATQMVVLFLLVIAGFISHKTKLMGGDFDKKLSNFVISVTTPSLIIASTMGKTMPDRHLILPLLGISVVTYIFLITLAYLIPHIMPIKREDHGMYSFMLAYGNVGFIGYPVAASLFGPDAVFYASILNIPNTLSIFIWGVMFVTGQKANGFKWSLLYSPAMVATYISILVVATGWRAPAALGQSFSLLGNMTIPASLLVIGSSIASIPAKKMMGNRGIYMMCAFRLFILPVSLYYLLLAFGVDSRLAGIDIILIGMPVAAFGTMFCLKYDKDETLMSQGTFLSTLLSVLSIPLLAMII